MRVREIDPVPNHNEHIVLYTPGIKGVWDVQKAICTGPVPLQMDSHFLNVFIFRRMILYVRNLELRDIIMLFHLIFWPSFLTKDLLSWITSTKNSLSFSFSVVATFHRLDGTFMIV